MTSSLTPLLDLINKNVAVLEDLCKSRGLVLPELNSAFELSSEAFRSIPGAAEAARQIASAAHHLAAIVEPPHVTVHHTQGGYAKSAALRVCLESNVSEILRDAGPEGLHVNDIAKINGQDPQKLARFLRMLATHYLYREVRPNVFAHTRPSSFLDSKKSIEELYAEPGERFANTNGVAALCLHQLDLDFKSAAFLWEACSDACTGNTSPNPTAFSRAMNTTDMFWDFLAKPEQAFRLKRFGIAMQGVAASLPPDAIGNAFDWKGLPTNSTIVDVGGGVGTVAQTVAKLRSDVNVVLQDLPGVIENATEAWSPELLNSGRVTLESHDLFTEQPRKHADVYVLKHILHNWSDENCSRILSRLRSAASASSKLVVLDAIVPFACPIPEGQLAGLDFRLPQAPDPLLPNYGPPGAVVYHIDMNMEVLLAAQERTTPQFVQLLREAGWEIKTIRKVAGDNSLVTIEAVPNY